MKRGTTIIELLVYIVILTSITTLIIVSILQLSGMFLRMRSERKLNAAAENALERIVREVRLARGIKCLGVGSPCVVTNPPATSGTYMELNSYSDWQANNLETHIFSRPNTLWAQVQLSRDTNPGIFYDLTPQGVHVTDLQFTKVAEKSNTGVIARQEAVNIRLSLTVEGAYGVARDYHATAILRGSY